MPKSTSKRLVVMVGLIMLVLITTYAEQLKDRPSHLHRHRPLQPFLSFAKDPKASLIKRGICCATKCVAWSYYKGIVPRVYFGHVKHCCNQFCVPGKWIW
jgi:hypothetical protein